MLIALVIFTFSTFWIFFIFFLLIMPFILILTAIILKTGIYTDIKKFYLNFKLENMLSKRVLE